MGGRLRGSESGTGLIRSVDYLDGWQGQSTGELLALRARCEPESLMLAFELALETQSLVRTLTEAEQNVLAVAAFAREMGDGGYALFFSHASARHAARIVEVLFELGCEDAARITRGALGVLRVEATPAALSARLAEAEPALLALLERADERYAALDVPLATHLLDWIAANAGRIRCADVAA